MTQRAVSPSFVIAASPIRNVCHSTATFGKISQRRGGLAWRRPLTVLVVGSHPVAVLLAHDDVGAEAVEGHRLLSSLQDPRVQLCQSKTPQDQARAMRIAAGGAGEGGTG